MNNHINWDEDTVFVFSLDTNNQLTYCPENIQGLMQTDKASLLKKPLNSLLDTDQLPDYVLDELKTSLSREVPWRAIIPFRVPGRGTVWFDVLVRAIFRGGKVTGSQWLMYKAEQEHAEKASQVYRSKGQALYSQLETPLLLALVAVVAVASSLLIHPLAFIPVLIAALIPLLKLRSNKRWEKALDQADGATAKSQHRIFGSESPLGKAMYELALRDSSLLALTSRLDEGNKVLAESVNTTAENAAQTADATEKTVAEIDQIAASMEEMGQTVDEIALNANDSSNACGEVSEQTKSAARFISDSSKKISTLVEEVSRSAEQTEELSRNADSVKEVSEQIDAIAEQTNLLALNAAIESARAGEHGRGFSVVADEVRSLSQKTQEAVDKIEATVNRMTTAMGAWREKMYQQRALAEECGELGRKSEQQVYEVSEAVTAINDRMTQIAVAAEQHTSAVSEVKESMMSINDNVRGANKLSRDTEGEVKAIKTRLREFRSLVEAFEED